MGTDVLPSLSNGLKAKVFLCIPCKSPDKKNLNLKFGGSPEKKLDTRLWYSAIIIFA